MAEYYVGIDIGGMTIKGIVLDKDGKALCEDVAVTGSENGLGFYVRHNRRTRLFNAQKVRRRQEDAHVGVGCPGIIDSENWRSGVFGPTSICATIPLQAS